MDLGIGNKSIYLKIVDYYKRLIELKVLKEGERLPSVRTLALELGINPNTVNRAYEQLAEEGLVSIIEKKGVFVATGKSDSELITCAKQAVEQLKSGGVDKGLLLEIIKEVYGDD